MSEPVDELAAARARRGEKRAKPVAAVADYPAGAMILDPKDPLTMAERFVAKGYTHHGMRTLVHWRDDFWHWAGGKFSRVSSDDLRKKAYPFLATAHRSDGGRDGDTRFKPMDRNVRELLAALPALVDVPRDIEPPAWLNDDPERPPAGEFVAVANGLLNLPRRELWDPNPAYFTLSASPVRYDEDAPPPERWLGFLDQLFPGDAESVACLQEWFGYLLSGETGLQKALLIVGPPRAGKGIIVRVLGWLIGGENVCGPTLASLNEPFGLSQLIGKSVATIADARLSGRTDKAALAERVLSITGEDTLSVARKFLPEWTGRLPTRFVITTNELPSLADTSGAFAGRFIVLQLRVSFEGREDRGLADTLRPELPGILQWSLDGWTRLRNRGRFEQPAAAVAALQNLHDLASPMKNFIRERCEVGDGLKVPISELFDAFKGWSEDQGGDTKRLSKNSFGRDLRAAVPHLDTRQTRSLTGKPVRHYTGIRLRPE